MYVGSFGGVIFRVSYQQVLTFSEMQRKLKANFTEHKILGKTAKLEYTGIAPVEISFKVKVFESFGIDVKSTLNNLREVCKNGLADYLIIGGENLGLYVLESLEETVLYTDGHGRTVAADVKLSLKEYNAVGDF